MLSSDERRRRERCPGASDKRRASVVHVDDIFLPVYRIENRAYGHACDSGFSAQHVRRPRAGELPFAAKLP